MSKGAINLESWEGKEREREDILSGPPSWVTASTKRSWSSTVQRRRGFGSVVRTRPESAWTVHMLLGLSLVAPWDALFGFLFEEENILSLSNLSLIISPDHTACELNSIWFFIFFSSEIGTELEEIQEQTNRVLCFETLFLSLRDIFWSLVAKKGCYSNPG